MLSIHIQVFFKLGHISSQGNRVEESGGVYCMMFFIAKKRPKKNDYNVTITPQPNYTENEASTMSDEK